MPKLLLEVDHVGHVYQTPEREIEALKDVSFQIEEGEFVSLVGPSGCGKSTLLAIAAGLEHPTYGEVRIDGKPITAPTTEIGFMPQKDQLFSWRNIRSNITLGLEIQRKGPEFYRKAEEMMEKYGLRDVGRMRPDQLSGGMRQRCSLIRTLVTDPRFLLLDEAFSALDYQTRVAVSVDIHTIIRNEHKTVLLVTHDISESLMLSDRVIVLTRRPGKVKAIHELSALKNIPPMERLEHEAFGSMIKDIWGELEVHE